MASPVLKCTICTNTPTFSDLSHLLTHVGSKGHLSAKFKLSNSTHGGQAPEVEQLLADYDRWERQLDLRRLLAERQSNKDSKSVGRTRARKSGSGPEPTVSKTLSKQQPEQGQAQGRHQLNHDDLLDPRLSQNQFGDQKFHTQTPLLQGRLPAPIHGYEVPNRGARSTHRQTDETESEGETKPTYPDPLKIARSLYPPRRQMTASSDSIPDVTDLSLPRNHSVETDDVVYDDTANLKGIMWPGMGIFDSASNEMKRKRNQKKDGSVLEQMMVTSTITEPTEVIFSPSGDVKKMRYISGNAEISSPLAGESPLMKKRATRSKNAFAEGNTNAAIGSKRRGRKPDTVVNHDQGLQQLSRQTLPFLMTSSPPASNLRRSNRTMPTRDEEEEFKLNIGAFSMQETHGIKVYGDNNASRQGADNSGLAHTGAMLHPMSAYPRFPRPQSQAYPSLTDPTKQTLHHSSVVQTSGQYTMYRKPVDQSNTGFGIGAGNETWMGHPHLQQSTVSGDHNRQLYVEWAAGSPHHQPQTYTTPTPYMTFGAFAGGSGSTNPLALALQNPFALGNQPRPGQAQTDFHFTSPRMVRPGMPNPTYASPPRATGSTKTERDSFYGGKGEN